MPLLLDHFSDGLGEPFCRLCPSITPRESIAHHVADTRDARTHLLFTLVRKVTATSDSS
jgi:hypothetical protein